MNKLNGKSDEAMRRNRAMIDLCPDLFAQGATILGLRERLDLSDRAARWFVRMCIDKSIMFSSKSSREARYFLSDVELKRWEARYAITKHARDKEVRKARYKLTYKRKTDGKVRNPERIPSGTSWATSKRVVDKRAHPWKTAEARITSETRVTICPAFNDYRFAADGKHREFQRLGLGRYLPFDRAGNPA